ncbi:MAG: mandelate racemase/muconate lactonizing enzyme family protein [Thermosphaera sp.]
MNKLKDIMTFPASIDYDDVVETEFKKSWGVQLFVRSVFDIGEGVGEVLVYGSGALRSYLGVLEDVVVPYVKSIHLNLDDFITLRHEDLRRKILRLVETIEKLIFTAGYCSVTLGAIGGFEMSLWDAISKVKETSLASIIGPVVRDRVKVYASFPRYNSMEKTLQAIDLALSRGFKIVKLHEKPNLLPGTLRKIREIYGYEIEVSIDINAPFDNPNDALEFIDSIYRYEPAWIEEPTWPPNDYEKLKVVATKSPIPIGAGENSYTLQDFRNLVRTGIKYLQPDISKVGGVAKFIEILNEIMRRREKDQEIMPHLRPHRSIIAHLFTVHVAAVHEEISLIEWPLAPPPYDLISEKIEVLNGEISLPRKIGLGISLNFDLLTSKYKYHYVPRFLRYSDL